MRSSLGKILRWAFTAAVLVMLVVFARRVDWAVTWRALRSASPPLLVAATLVNLLSLVAKGVRWWIFLRPVGATSLWLAVRATFAGAGLNNVLVAQGGEAARVVFVARAARVPAARVLATLLLERLFELVGYVVLLALALAFLDLPHMLERTRPVAYLALALAAALLVYLVRLRTHPPRGDAAPEHGQGGRVRHFLRHFASTVGDLSTGPRFAGALALSVLIWALQVATYHLTAMAAHFPISLVGTIAALLAVNIGFAIRATPGNVGLFQLLYAAVGVAFGLDKAQAIAVAFLIQTQQVLPVTLLGIAAAPEFLFKRRRSSGAPDVGGHG